MIGMSCLCSESAPGNQPARTSPLADVSRSNRRSHALCASSKIVAGDPQFSHHGVQGRERPETRGAAEHHRSPGVRGRGVPSQLAQARR
jgi:hypothetical protein